MSSFVAPCVLFVSLLSLLTNLPTTVCTPSANQQNTNNACNTCCYGQPGQPGIPGIPGTPGGFGPTGAPGSKGDRGELTRGEPGQRGERGNEGVKGNQGSEGTPGKQGPLGRIGPQGIKGNNGSKGDKGESGSHQPQVRTSAFTALRTTHVLPAEKTITFTTTEINAGENFDKTSGKFTCQVAGVYFFMYSLLSYANGGDVYVKMVLNERLITSVHSNDVTKHEHQSSGATLQLNVGDQVWLVNEGDRRVYGGGGHPLTFTGFMVSNLD